MPAPVAAVFGAAVASLAACASCDPACELLDSFLGMLHCIRAFVARSLTSRRTHAVSFGQAIHQGYRVLSGSGLAMCRSPALTDTCTQHDSAYPSDTVHGVMVSGSNGDQWLKVESATSHLRRYLPYKVDGTTYLEVVDFVSDAGAGDSPVNSMKVGNDLALRTAPGSRTRGLTASPPSNYSSVRPTSVQHDCSLGWVLATTASSTRWYYLVLIRDILLLCNDQPQTSAMDGNSEDELADYVEYSLMLQDAPVCRWGRNVAVSASGAPQVTLRYDLDNHAHFAHKAFMAAIGGAPVVSEEEAALKEKKVESVWSSAPPPPAPGIRTSSEAVSVARLAGPNAFDGIWTDAHATGLVLTTVKDGKIYWDAQDVTDFTIVDAITLTTTLTDGEHIATLDKDGRLKWDYGPRWSRHSRDTEQFPPERSALLEYRVSSKSKLSGTHAGVSYRNTPNLIDRVSDAYEPDAVPPECFAKWGSIVYGALVNADWVEVGGLYLPITLRGEAVLTRAVFQPEHCAEQEGTLMRRSSAPIPRKDNGEPFKVLVLGGTSLLGRPLIHELIARGFSVTCMSSKEFQDLSSVVQRLLSRLNVEHIKIDLLADLSKRGTPQLKKVLQTGGFDLVVNLICKTGTSDAVMNAARLLNVELPGCLAKLVDGLSVKAIHVSSDCVWSGRGNNKNGYPAVEVGSDPRFMESGAGDPYTRQKRAAEEKVKTSANVTVIRVPGLLYGPMAHPDECCIVSESLRNLLGENNQFHDNRQKFYPTSTWDSAHVIASLARKLMIEGLVQKVYHYGSQESMTKYELMSLFARALGLPMARVKKGNVSKQTGPGKVPPQDVKLDTFRSHVELVHEGDWREPSVLDESVVEALWHPHFGPDIAAAVDGKEEKAVSLAPPASCYAGSPVVVERYDLTPQASKLTLPQQGSQLTLNTSSLAAPFDGLEPTVTFEFLLPYSDGWQGEFVTLAERSSSAAGIPHGGLDFGNFAITSCSGEVIAKDDDPVSGHFPIRVRYTIISSRINGSASQPLSLEGLAGREQGDQKRDRTVSDEERLRLAQLEALKSDADSLGDSKELAFLRDMEEQRQAMEQTVLELEAAKASDQRKQQDQIASEQSEQQQRQEEEEERFEFEAAQEELARQRSAIQHLESELEAARVEEQNKEKERIAAEQLELQRIELDAAKLAERRKEEERISAEQIELQREARAAEKAEERRRERERIASANREAERLEIEERMKKQRLEDERLALEFLQAKQAEEKRQQQERIALEELELQTRLEQKAGAARELKALQKAKDEEEQKRGRKQEKEREIGDVDAVDASAQVYDISSARERDGSLPSTPLRPARGRKVEEDIAMGADADASSSSTAVRSREDLGAACSVGRSAERYAELADPATPSRVTPTRATPSREDVYARTRTMRLSELDEQLERRRNRNAAWEQRRRCMHSSSPERQTKKSDDDDGASTTTDLAATPATTAGIGRGFSTTTSTASTPTMATPTPPAFRPSGGLSAPTLSSAGDGITVSDEDYVRTSSTGRNRRANARAQAEALLAKAKGKRLPRGDDEYGKDSSSRSLGGQLAGLPPRARLVQ